MSLTTPALSCAGTVLFPFLRALAHDMAAPLTSTLGYAQLNLESPGSASEIHEDFGHIAASSQAMRAQVGILGRLSRYLPDESTSSAHQLIEDLRVLSVSLARSAGGAMTWECVENLREVTVLGNPWLLRTTSLALFGSLCRCSQVHMTVSLSEDFLTLRFPEPDSEPPAAAPDQWGCRNLGEELAEAQALQLEKESEWRLLLPLAKASI